MTESMNWKNPWHVTAFVINGLVVLGSWGLLFTGHLRQFLFVFLAYFGFFLIWVLFYWLPNYLRARKLHGKPIPPLVLHFGPVDSQTKVALSRLEQKKAKYRSRWLRKPLDNVLYEAVLHTEDGDWHYFAETCNSHLVAYAYTFKSGKSKFLDYSVGRAKNAAYFLAMN